MITNPTANFDVHKLRADERAAYVHTGIYDVQISYCIAQVFDEVEC